MTEEERYAKVENEKKAALDQSNNTYNELLNSNSQLAQQQKDYINNWQKTQNEIADKNANYQTELQNQNKQKAEKEFQNEAIASKNAYYDFINPYGAQAEIQAQNGLNNSGYSETSKLGAWNTQQNRTAAARTTLNNAKQQYDNAIKEIELNRDTTKSQYALEALQQQLNAALEEFNKSSELKQGLLSNNQSIDNEYNNRYNNVWNQINTEKQQAEAIRQFNENMAEQKRQADLDYKYKQQSLAQSQAQWEKEYALNLQKLAASQLSENLTDNSNNYDETDIKVNSVFGNTSPVSGDSKILKNNDHYFIKVNDDYVDVTSEVNESLKNGICLRW